MTKKQSHNWEYQIDEITYKKGGGYSKCVHLHTRRQGVRKLVRRCVHTKQMAQQTILKSF